MDRNKKIVFVDFGVFSIVFLRRCKEILFLWVISILNSLIKFLKSFFNGEKMSNKKLSPMIVPNKISSIKVTKPIVSKNFIFKKYGVAIVDTCYTLPENKGKVILDKIDSALHSIAIGIYSIGGPVLLAALKRAKLRGVNLKVLQNGTPFVANETGSKNIKVSQDLRFFNPVLFMYKSLKEAPGSGTVDFNWTPSNYALTHLKTILIDANQKKGFKSKGVLIMTNNLQAFGWESL